MGITIIAIATGSTRTVAIRSIASFSATVTIAVSMTITIKSNSSVNFPWYYQESST